MKYCVNCGSEINGTAFCTKCGAKAPEDVNPIPETPVTDPYNPYQPPVQKNNGKIIAIAGAAVAAIVVVVVAVSLIAGRGYKSVVKQYMNAMKKGNAKKIVSLMPKKMVKSIADDEYDGDKDEMIEDLDEELEEVISLAEDNGAKMSKMTYKIIDSEDLTGKDLKNEIEEYEDEYGIKIKKAKEVTVKATMPVDGEKESTKLTIEVVKIGGSWYIVDPDL